MKKLIIISFSSVILIGCSTIDTSLTRKPRAFPVPQEDLHQYAGRRQEVVCRLIVSGRDHEDNLIYRTRCS